MVNIGMGIAIFISCMGLFGLAAFTANQRTKEIGIRKVLGASVPHLVVLLSRQFIVLVLLATLIAAPLASWGRTSMAAELCLSDDDALVDICDGWICRDSNRVANGQFAGCSGGQS